MKTIRLLLITIMLFPAALYSQTVYVNSSTGNDATGDGSAGNPYKTFHKGYTMTSSGGTLDLTGTFTWTDAGETGDAATNGYTINKAITIQGQGPENTFIQSATTENTADRRVFTFGNYDITVRNLSIRYGKVTTDYSNYGAGISIGSSSTNKLFENCNFENNHWYTTVSYTGQWVGGGAIAIYNSNTNPNSVTFNNCNIRNNYCNRQGSAIWS